MRRAILLPTIVAAVAATTGVAWAAFVDTTSNSGNSFAAASAFDRCYYDDVLADNPVSYWRLNETSGTSAADVQGANNGSYGNSPTLGQSGALAAGANKAVQLNGTDQYVTVPNTSSLSPTSAVTVEAWVRPTTATAGINSQAVSKSFSAFFTPWNDYALLTNGPGAKPYLEMTIGGTNRQVVGDSALPTATFSHLVGTYDGSTMRLYVNGRLVGSGSYSGSIATSGQPLQIGRLASGHNYFNGRVDEVAVYNSALSASRVLAHYNAGRCYRDEALADNPAAYWRLGETSNNTAFDTKSTNAGTYSNSPTINQTGALDGDSNKAVHFDGSSEYVTIPHTSALAPTSAITVEAWVEPDTVSAGQKRVVAKPFSSYAAPYNDYALIVNSGFSLPSFVLTIGGTERTQVTLPVLPTSTFSHLVGTYDGSTMKFYVDGVLTASDAYSGSIASSGQPLQIGRLPGGNYLNGAVDEVAVYNTALSEARIQAHYIAGRAYRDVVLDSSPVSYWRLGESSGTSAADETNAHNGTYTNGPTLAKSGAIAGNQNSAVSFDGVDDHVTTGDLSVCEGTNFSIEAWAKGTSASTNLWVTSEGSTTNNSPICGLVHEGANARFYVRDNTGTPTTPTGSTGTFNDDNWHHLVGVRSGNTFTLYVDGVQAAQTTATLGAIAVDTSAIGALKRAAVGNYYPGSVDDVAIYDAALTPIQVKLHYDAGKDAPR